MFTFCHLLSLDTDADPQWDDRLLSFDPASISHVLKHTTIYEKPWQSRRLIESLIGCGMLAAEGQVHKRQRRVISPSFSVQNLRALVSIGFRKGDELGNKWMDMVVEGNGSAKVDVCHWISRATFDVIGIAGEWLTGLRTFMIYDLPVQVSTTSSMPSKVKRTSFLTLTRTCLNLRYRKGKHSGVLSQSTCLFSILYS
jgi:hypothetical protein